MSDNLELDHVVVGVVDLEAAAAAVRGRGFAVTAGGRHRGFGTRNMLVRFPTAYLELITVTDPAEARAGGRGTLVDRLAERGDGFVAYALRTASVTTLLHRADAAGATMTGPVRMSRAADSAADPAGGADQAPQAAWALAKPFGDQYGGWWPFFIEWQRGGPGSAAYICAPHPNGAREIGDITVATPSLDDVAAWMRQICHLRAADAAPGGLREHTYALGNARLRFVERAGRSAPVGAAHGGGVVSVGLVADDTRGLPDAPSPGTTAGEWLDQLTA